MCFSDITEIVTPQGYVHKIENDKHQIIWERKWNVSYEGLEGKATNNPSNPSTCTYGQTVTPLAPTTYTEWTFNDWTPLSQTCTGQDMTFTANIQPSFRFRLLAESVNEQTISYGALDHDCVVAFSSGVSSWDGSTFLSYVQRDGSIYYIQHYGGATFGTRMVNFVRMKTGDSLSVKGNFCPSTSVAYEIGPYNCQVLVDTVDYVTEISSLSPIVKYASFEFIVRYSGTDTTYNCNVGITPTS